MSIASLTRSLLNHVKSPHYVTLVVRTEKEAHDPIMRVYAKHLSNKVWRNLSTDESHSLSRQLANFDLAQFTQKNILSMDKQLVSRTTQLGDDSLVDLSLLAKVPVEIDLSNSIYREMRIKPPNHIEVIQFNVGQRWDRRKIEHAATVGALTVGGSIATIGIVNTFSKQKK
jgi:hypothetical protein